MHELTRANSSYLDLRIIIIIFFFRSKLQWEAELNCRLMLESSCSDSQRRLLEGWSGLHEAVWGVAFWEYWFSSLLTPTVHSRRCLSSLSVREKFCNRTHTQKKSLLQTWQQTASIGLQYKDAVHVESISCSKYITDRPDDIDHTGTASLRCAPSCVCPGGSAEWTAYHTHHKRMVFPLEATAGVKYVLPFCYNSLHFWLLLN